MSADLPLTLPVAGENPPLTELAYRLIRERILQGLIAAGTKLKIDVLQRDFQISSSPLREALNRLVAENLVVADERRGFRAAPVSHRDLMDLTTMRLVVEPGALAAAMQAGTDGWEAQVVAAHYRLDRVEERIARREMARNDEWTARHKEFHIALIAACGSERLMALCSSLFDQSERYRRLSASLRRRPRDTAREHERIMEAALRRDARAVDLLRTHIARTAEHVAPALVRQKS